MGRPSKFSEALAKTILDRLASGEPLAVICRDDGMPHPSTFKDWCDDEEKTLGSVSLAIAYGRARDDGFDAIASECVAIAEDGTNDWMERLDPKSGALIGWQVNGEHVQRSKLRIETRLKLLAKWDPKRYGELLKLGDPDANAMTVRLAAGDEKL